MKTQHSEGQVLIGCRVCGARELEKSGFHLLSRKCTSGKCHLWRLFSTNQQTPILLNGSQLTLPNPRRTNLYIWRTRSIFDDFDDSIVSPSTVASSEYYLVLPRFHRKLGRSALPDTIQSYPIQSYPIQSYPIQSYPIQSYPILSNPIQSNPIRSNPIQSNPIQSNPIQSNPIQYNTIRYDTIRCDAMRCDAMQCNALQCNAMQCNAKQCNAMQCNAMQCNAMQYNTIQYNTIQYIYKVKTIAQRIRRPNIVLIYSIVIYSINININMFT